MECIICCENSGHITSTLTKKSLDVIRSYAKGWAEIGKYSDIYNRLKKFSLTEDENLSYHRRCYQFLCNKTNLSRGKTQYDLELKAAQESSKKRKSTSLECASKILKSFDSNTCIFCQEIIEGEDLHNVTSQTVCDNL